MRFSLVHSPNLHQYLYDLLIFLDKVYHGKKNILTAKDPYQIGVTSGTSGKSSLLPTVNDVNRTFVVNGVFVAMNAMFDTYPKVRTLFDLVSIVTS